MDSRSQPLVFKASIYCLRSDLLLVDFRRSSVRLQTLPSTIIIGGEGASPPSRTSGVIFYILVIWCSILQLSTYFFFGIFHACASWRQFCESPSLYVQLLQPMLTHHSTRTCRHVSSGANAPCQVQHYLYVVCKPDSNCTGARICSTV